jgi:hypothetical protein
MIQYNKMRFLHQNKSLFTLIAVMFYLFCFVDSFFLDDDNHEKEDPAEARSIGKLPNLNITTFLAAAMEPNNAMVQVMSD